LGYGDVAGQFIVEVSVVSRNVTSNGQSRSQSVAETGSVDVSSNCIEASRSEGGNAVHHTRESLPPNEGERSLADLFGLVDLQEWGVVSRQINLSPFGS